MAPRANCSHTEQGFCRRCPHYGYTKWQGYYLSVPSLRRQLPLSLVSQAASPAPCFYDLLTEGSTNWVWAALASTPPDHQAILPSNIHEVSPGQKLCPLEALPTETLYMIIANIDRDPINDMESFGLSSPVFWPFLSQEIHLAYQKATPHLAGRQLYFESVRGHPGSYNNPASSRSLKTAECLFTVRAKILSRFSSLRQWVLEDGTTIGAGEEKNIINDLDFMIHFPQDRVWLLRNSTKRIYVSSTSLEGTGVEFHHVLLCRISQLRGAFFGGGDNKDDCGVWAGDRFDLVTESVHLAQIETDAEDTPADIQQPWQDVSEEVVAFTEARLRDALDAKDFTIAQARSFQPMWYGRSGRRTED